MNTIKTLKTTLNVLASLATIAGIAFFVVQYMQTERSLAPAELIYMKDQESSLSGQVVKGADGTPSATAQTTGILTNTGRQTVTVLHAIDVDGELIDNVEWIHLGNHNSTTGKNTPNIGPFIIEPGNAFRVTVPVTKNKFSYPPTFKLSDGRTKQPDAS